MSSWKALGAINRVVLVQRLLLRYTQALLTQMPDRGVQLPSFYRATTVPLALVDARPLPSNELVMTQELVAARLASGEKALPRPDACKAGILSYRRGHRCPADRDSRPRVALRRRWQEIAAALTSGTGSKSPVAANPRYRDESNDRRFRGGLFADCSRILRRCCSCCFRC
jgi:hypothetical protein